MTISLLITSFGKTGVESTMVRLANGILQAGYEVHFVVMSSAGTAFRAMLDPDVRIIDLKSPRLWTSLPALVRYVKSERPAAMIAAAHLANGLAGLAKRLSGNVTPVILTEHGFQLFGVPRGKALQAKIKHRILKFVLERGYREADALVAVSEGVAAELRRLPYISRDRIHVIYNPVWSPELARAAQQHVDHPWYADRDAIPVIVAAGRLAEEKGFDLLLQAMSIVQQRFPVRLMLLGEGEQRERLSQLIEELGLQDTVQLAGFVDNPLAHMARASLFVMSSIYEPFGNVIVEALSCATPVVSTDCPTGPREILQDGRFGVLVPVGDAEALADGINEALSKSPHRETLMERAAYFSVENATKKYIKLIEMLAKP